MSSEIQRTGVEETTLGEVVKVMKATRIYQGKMLFFETLAASFNMTILQMLLILQSQRYLKSVPDWPLADWFWPSRTGLGSSKEFLSTSIQTISTMP
jgi:hypothetical protein